MGKRKRHQQEPCWRFAEGSCRFGDQCWFAHSRVVEQPDTNASGPCKVEKTTAELVGEVERLKQELHESEQARAELQRELDERTEREDELRVELEASRQASEQAVSIQAECDELRERLQDALARPSGASSCGAEWCFQSGPCQWTSLPPDRSADLLRRYQDFRQGGNAIFRMRSGVEEYMFDLSGMSQTNIRTGKARAIRCELHVPSNWTRCTSLESVCQTRDRTSFEVSGFQDARMNGTYMLSGFHKIHVRNAWWHVLGHAVMYESFSDQKLFLLCVGQMYSEKRTAMYFQGRNCGEARCVDVDAALFNCDKAGWDEKVARSWEPSRHARVVSGLSSVSPVMEIAVEFWDKPVLERFDELLRGSVVHQTQHHGASRCSSFKDTVNVVRVLRIENWHLWMKYSNHLEQVRRDLATLGIDPEDIEPTLPAALPLPPECGFPDTRSGEYMLFHGTDYGTAVKIAQEGFDFRLSEPGYYGQGTYFSSQACKSHKYAKKYAKKWNGLHTIIFGRVVVGDVAYADKVDRKCKRPPPRVGTSRCCDTVVAEPGPMPGHRDGQQTHQEFVIFDKFQAYPEFLIQYKCGP